MSMNEERDELEKTKEKKGNLPKNLLLIVAVLIMAVVLVNSMVTARTPVLTVSGDPGGPLKFAAPASSCCSVEQAESPLGQVRQQALAYYNETFEDQATDAEIEDYGCHQEIVILKDGVPLRRLAYNNGVFSDLGPIIDKPGN